MIRLALPCSRPKSRTRLNRLGKTCRSKRQRNSAPGRDWIISWPVLSLIRKVMIPCQSLRIFFSEITPR
jgi:hypothetical protein